MNKFHGIGNLTRDPEIRTTTTGKKVVNFGLALNGKPYKKDGEQLRDTTFIDCEAWEKTAEFVANWFEKGSPIVVEDAELKQDNWEDKTTGDKRSKIKLRVNQVSFPPRNDGGGERAAAEDAPDRATAAATPSPAPAKGRAKARAKAAVTAVATAPPFDDDDKPQDFFPAGAGAQEEIPF